LLPKPQEKLGSKLTNLREKSSTAQPNLRRFNERIKDPKQFNSSHRSSATEVSATGAALKHRLRSWRARIWRTTHFFHCRAILHCSFSRDSAGRVCDSAPQLHQPTEPEDMSPPREKRPRAPVSYRRPHCGATFTGPNRRAMYRSHLSRSRECTQAIQLLVRKQVRARFTRDRI
jgi:hypothetical protein